VADIEPARTLLEGKLPDPVKSSQASSSHAFYWQAALPIRLKRGERFQLQVALLNGMRRVLAYTGRSTREMPGVVIQAAIVGDEGQKLIASQNRVYRAARSAVVDSSRRASSAIFAFTPASIPSRFLLHLLHLP
jgi:hypothetical protein